MPVSMFRSQHSLHHDRGGVSGAGHARNSGRRQSTGVGETRRLRSNSLSRSFWASCGDQSNRPIVQTRACSMGKWTRTVMGNEEKAWTSRNSGYWTAREDPFWGVCLTDDGTMHGIGQARHLIRRLPICHFALFQMCVYRWSRSCQTCSRMMFVNLDDRMRLHSVTQHLRIDALPVRHGPGWACIYVDPAICGWVLRDVRDGLDGRH